MNKNLSLNPDKPLRAVILTALPIEYSCIREHLFAPREMVHKGSVYEIGNFQGINSAWSVLIAEIGAGNDGASAEAERAIDFFHPEIAFFVGVAGGVKDVSLCDVIAGTKVYGYECGKADETFKTRPDLGISSYSLVQRARAEARKQDWMERCKNDIKTDSLPKVIIGPIAAGEKVVASTKSPTYEFLKNNYSDSLAVEMEGRGFLEALSMNQEVYSLIIRGISDLIDGKTDVDRRGMQRIAAMHASAFAFEVLSKYLSNEIIRITITVDGIHDQTEALALVNSLKTLLKDSSLKIEVYE
jgi:nucleoside phosphorylase